ncbi:MAG: winged helix-turn-helix domain-containing protein [Alcanivoracaceae bacterium]|nr:winged helix-turn-helix domain-containing protein [Alcanivoracaceae bacterium]
MRWRIKDFIFCEQQQTLTSIEDGQTQTQQLEPMVVELLAYFCRNPDQIISRYQLIEVVWLGRMITDNAVNKVITKLRKSFNDDAKKPQFIATFPKKGYKFIVAVTQIIEEPANDASDSIKAQAPLTSTKKKIFYSSLLLSIIFLFSIAITWQLHKKQQPITQVKALTRDPGRESRPQVSPNGKYLAYVEVRDKKMHQWIKSLVDETVIEISHGEGQRVWVDSVSWNSDGSRIVYLVTTPKSCQYYMRSFKQMATGEPKLLHNCPADSYGKIAYTHDDNRLVYTESNGRNTPFSLFEMNLTTGIKHRLNQPELFLGGNSQFDMHPTENKLLISSPDKQQWEGFYSLDLETDELTLLFKQDAYICCGIWNHAGDRVVLMGEHPAYELVSYDLQGNDQRVIYTGSEQLRVPERHINGEDYLFSVIHVNQDAHYFDLNTNSKNIIANTSVDDRLATFAHHNKQVAYIGLSSGSEEVWITDNNGKQRRKLTNFNDSRHYIELLWSYNGDYLMGLALNEIHLIDSKSGQSQVLKIPQVEIRGVSWKNNHTISYSIKNKEGWQVNNYDIASHSASVENEKWSFIRYAESSDDVLRQDKSGHLFLGHEQIKVLDNELLQAEFMNGRTFNLKKSASIWAWQTRVDGKYQLMLKQELNQPAKHMLDSDSYHFDFLKKGILYHTVDNLNADIYQSLSQ